MATPFIMTRDINGYNGFGLPFAEDKYSATIATTTDTTLTVPSTGLLGRTSDNVNKYVAVFSFEPGSSVWVAVNESAESPAGATFASTTSELNPAARAVQAGDVLHFYTTDVSAAVGVTIYGTL